MRVLVDSIAEMIDRLGITDLVVWGLRSSQHTTRYVHRAIHDAFGEIARNGRCRAHWYDDEPRRLAKRSRFGAKNRYLFFTNPHDVCDEHVPVMDDAFYIAHADENYSYEPRLPITKYDEHLKHGRAVYWKVFRGFPSAEEGYSAVDRSALVFFNDLERRVVMPWATDLMPREIEENKKVVTSMWQRGALFRGIKVLFVGTAWWLNEDALKHFAEACDQEGLCFGVQKIEPVDELVRATQSCYMAPAIQGEAHCTSQDTFYVPCRIFKNVSYGALGVTNNPGVDNLFHGKLVCDTKPQGLIQRYRQHVQDFDEDKLGEMLGLMDEVRDKHTYLNRIWQCLAFMRS